MEITISESVADWWHSPRILKHESTSRSVALTDYVEARSRNIDIERNLLRMMLSEKVTLKDDSLSVMKGSFLDTDVEPGVIIHEFCLQRSDSPETPRHVVFVHGFMAALGFFAYNVEPLVMADPNVVVHVLDLPGFGNLSRPRFPTSLLDSETEVQVRATERWFTDKLEKWRQFRGIECFDLVGHSMGGYLAACYTETYSEAVTRLVLLSPMGTEASNVSLINHDDNDLEGDDPLDELFAKYGQPSFPKHWVIRWIWGHHLSPVGVLQWSGPLFSKVLSYWSYRRFMGADPALVRSLHDYSFSIFNQFQKSGEIAITTLVNHEILPYLPLSQRGLADCVSRNNIPVMIIYGEGDWMNEKGGRHLEAKINTAGGDARFHKLPGGHHMYLDNPVPLNEKLLNFLDYKV